jgi:hypothetical protein
MLRHLIKNDTDTTTPQAFVRRRFTNPVYQSVLARDPPQPPAREVLPQRLKNARAANRSWRIDSCRLSSLNPPRHIHCLMQDTNDQHGVAAELIIYAMPLTADRARRGS